MLFVWYKMEVKPKESFFRYANQKIYFLTTAVLLSFRLKCFIGERRLILYLRLRRRLFRCSTLSKY